MVALRPKVARLAIIVCACQLLQLLSGVAFTSLPSRSWLWASRKVTPLRATLVDENGAPFERFTVDTGEPVQAKRSPSPRRAQKQEPVEEPENQEWYEGTVKSYFPEQGFGFIQCDELFEKHQVDVFLHKNQVDQHLGRRAFPGEKVRFLVGLNKEKKPQARNVARCMGDGKSWLDGSKTYVGRVKQYWPEKGFGFIACEETQSIFQCDVFLHKKQMEDAQLERGNLVTFSVEVNAKSRPQARNVERVSTPSYASAAATEPAEESSSVQMEDA
mmetsp:Transcript_19883/g.46529  ORF Transcript_19883/g.46529 Transcript_19883/m.46529 type:complete len:273 (+) Transcript_19883:68-886(+)